MSIQDDTHTRAAATELGLRLKYDATPEQVGVSRTRIRAIAEVLRSLEHATPEVLHPRTDLNADVASADARRTVRYLVTLAPDHVADRDLDAFVFWLLGGAHTRFSLELVGEVLRAEFAREVEATRLRRVGALLRRGYSRREVVAEAGVSEDTVKRVNAFLGCSEAREAAIPHEAERAIESGQTDVAEFARRFRISKADAEAELAEAARVLDLDPTEELVA